MNNWAAAVPSTLQTSRAGSRHVFAQFGPPLYGICAACWYYFGTSPWNNSDFELAQLMGVLSLPDLVTRDPVGHLPPGRHPPCSPWNLVNGSRECVGIGADQWPWRMADAVATVGITDTAGSHSGRRADADGAQHPPECAEPHRWPDRAGCGALVP